MINLPDVLAAAKLRLISTAAANLPYLSSGLYALVTVQTDEITTLVADENWHLYINPTWASNTSVDDLAREIAHHLWHLVLDHAGRAREIGVDEASAWAWAEASDLALVDAVGAAGFLPAWLIERARRLRLHRPDLVETATAEEHWMLLARPGTPPADLEDAPADDDTEPHNSSPDESQPATSKREGSASDGLRRPWELPPNAPIGGLDDAQAALVRRTVADAILDHDVGAPGEIPGALTRWARAVAEPRLPWETLLAQAARRGLGWTSGRTHTTYTRPNRRASSTPDLALPGWRRPTPAVACIVDTSGSVNEDLLSQALSEVDGAIAALGVAASEVTLLTCDAALHTLARIRRANDATIVGGGGTDLRVALAAVETLRPRPTLTVVFTDGLTPWPDAPPLGSAVVVALLLRPGAVAPIVPSWASVIECRP